MTNPNPTNDLRPLRTGETASPDRQVTDALAVKRSPGATFLLVVMLAGALLVALYFVPPALVAAVVIGTSIWIAVDARSLGYEPSEIGGLAGMGPLAWFFAGLLLWIVALPLYLVKRGELKAAGQRRHAGALGDPAQEPLSAERFGERPRPARRRIPKSHIAAAVVLVIAIFIAYGALGASRVSADVPPSGQIWVGSSFDAETFAVRERTETVDVNAAIVVVGHLPESQQADDLNLRLSLDGELLGVLPISSDPLNATGEGDIFGFSAGPLGEAGTWTFEFTDVGGNVLASGSVTAQAPAQGSAASWAER